MVFSEFDSPFEKNPESVDGGVRTSYLDQFHSSDYYEDIIIIR